MAQYSEEWFYPTGQLATNQRAAVFGPGDDNVVAPIFSDPAMTVPLANPTVTDAAGMLTFYAPDGNYWIWVGPTTGGNGIEITLGASPDNPVLSVNGVAPDGGGNVTLTAADVDAQPITTINAAGDLYVGTGPDATTRLPIGSAGEVLTVVAGTASWEPGGGGGAVDSVNGQVGVVVLDATDVGADPAGSAAAAAAASQPLATIDAAGDLYVGTGNNTTTRLPAGANAEVLTIVAGVPNWEPVPSAPVTSVNGETGVVVLDAGDVGADVAGAAAAAQAAAEAASQPLATIDALGDLYVGTGPNITARLPRGANGEVLATNDGEPTGLEWIPAPGGAVDSVNGQTGVVVLDATDVGADPAGSAAAAQAAAEAASQPLSTIDAAGDLYVGTGNNTTTRLPAGSNTEVLTIVAGVPNWEPAPTGAVTSVNGDTGVVVLTAADVGAVATVGTSDIVYGTDDAGAQTTYNVEGLTDETILFSDDRNVLTAGNGDARWYNRTGRALIIVGAWASVGIQPTGAAILVDVNINGTTIYSTQANRPTVAISTNGGGISATPDVTALAIGDYLTVDIDQIGSTIPGGRLTVGIVARQNI